MDSTTTIVAAEPIAETATEPIVVGVFLPPETWRQWEDWQFQEETCES